jgi:hypothetical protein
MKLIEIISEAQWSGSVKTKKHSPEGLFATGSASAIAKWLKAEHKDKHGAMSALNFYKNRAGKNLSAERKSVFDQVAKDLA